MIKGSATEKCETYLPHVTMARKTNLLTPSPFWNAPTGSVTPNLKMIPDFSVNASLFLTLPPLIFYLNDSDYENCTVGDDSAPLLLLKCL